MSHPSFRVYIDESGEEGFVFNADGSGSSRWLVLSAVVTRWENDLIVVELMDKVRAILRRERRQPLHFYRLEHSQRVPYAREIGTAALRTVSILIHKPSISDPEKFRSQKHLLYRYACRFLLERVSWLCREKRKIGHGDGRAEVIFSNRSQMSYDAIRDYFRNLRETPPDEISVTIDWAVIDPDLIRAVEHSQLAGLQVADAVASSFYMAVNQNLYGDVEPKYGKLLLPTAYRHKNTLLGYGVKFWPEDFQKIESANPHISWFAEQDKT